MQTETRDRDIGHPTAHDLEQHRVELNGYCYRMMGSAFEAEDAVQETLLRAFRALDGFEARCSLRSWLYRIATNVCLKMVSARQRRARPMDLGPAWSAQSALGAALEEHTWLEPVPDHQVLGRSGADTLAARESIRLAFVAALQLLPPRQRAVLILRDVLHWEAREVADLLSCSVASANSALQRARSTLAARRPVLGDVREPEDEAQRVLLGRYVTAFESFDVSALVSLLHEEATLSMPPYALWLQGPAEIERWWQGPGAKCRGSRLLGVAANGSPAFAQYRRAPDGQLAAFALHVLELCDGRILNHNSFLDTARLFPLFGVPMTFPHPSQEKRSRRDEFRGASGSTDRIG